MIYEYRCERCDLLFDVYKSVKEMDTLENCIKCESPAARIFIPRPLYFSGASVENAEYNPGLGCIVKNKVHRKEIAKQKGLIEVGSEKPETLHKMYDKAREERREKAWNEATKGWVGNGE